MAWSVPMTAVTGSVFTAALFNQHVRDNLAETAVARAVSGTAGSIIAGNGLNAIALRDPGYATATGGSTTSSTSYTDLADAAGPTLTLDTGTKAMVWIFCNQYNQNTTAAWIAFEVGGTSSIVAADDMAVQMQGSDGDRAGAGFLVDTLTSGSNSFTCKYRCSTAGPAYFSQRRIVVWPF